MHGERGSSSGSGRAPAARGAPRPGAPDARARSLAPPLGAVVAQLGTADFGPALLGFLRSEVRFDSALVLCYRPERGPSLIAEEFHHPLRRNTVEAYLAGAWRLDPFYRRARRMRVPAVVRMRDIRPPNFRRTRYFLDYYQRSGVSDEVNYLVPVDCGSVMAVCLERSAASCEFRDADLLRLDAWLPFVSAAASRHARATRAPDWDAPAQAGEPPVSDRLVSSIGERRLTRRETQVLQRMLECRTVRAIAGEFGVSVGTVRVHRRNIYRKLSVNSVSQLFSLALSRALRAPPGPAAAGTGD